ncbi:acylphosphatase [Kitasatospora cheerisanensis KCTC 2395]|uniref:Acylphosphatase n=1 Tax=Kitasatospora cheerisanensis KCTC 2395 TaxID=1348663 RepID=A0A066ZD55_9ACTN|nr:acylphosphatase [Kitasatospora cheerisanensis KCTC 2395]
MAASGARWVRVIRRRVLVSGTVQGVFFRDSCRRAAAEAGVAGWVRNLPDGRVEAVFEGDDAPVERMVAWMRRGPSRAEVEHVEVIPEPLEGLLVFAITD